jgi:hypothetical protein
MFSKNVKRKFHKTKCYVTVFFKLYELWFSTWTLLTNNGEQVPEVGRDNLLDPGEARPEVNHLLEARHFIFQILVEIVDKLQKKKREKKVKQEQEQELV